VDDRPDHDQERTGLAQPTPEASRMNESSSADRGEGPITIENAVGRKAILEAKLLEEQLTQSHKIREWIKALTGLGAIAALLAVFFQLQQGYAQRADDRLERAMTRLASPNVSERLAGVSTLRIVLDEGPKSQRRIALSALANSLGAENEPVVSGAVLDLLKRTDSGSRDSVLEELANASRGLLPAAMKKEPRQAYEPFVVDHGDFARLKSLEGAIVAFLHAGARTSDLSGIYCVECKLEGLDLRGVDFSGAVLGNASFIHSILEKSSFEHAILTATNFTGADLRNAKFTVEPQNTAFASDAITNGGETAWGPDFTCANLEDADFSRQQLLSFVEERPDFITPGSFFTAKFSKADLARADFRSVGVYGAITPRSKAESTPAARFMFMRLGFPLPMDLFSLPDVPREMDLPLPNGVKKVRYQPFGGSLNSALPMGNDVRKFATSLNEIARAFANSNWGDARLPNSLRQFLTQAQVPASRSGACITAGQ
jgi:uncharacterized protein YjbI with pentapeptide repeats